MVETAAQKKQQAGENNNAKSCLKRKFTQAFNAVKFSTSSEKQNLTNVEDFGDKSSCQKDMSENEDQYQENGGILADHESIEYNGVGGQESASRKGSSERSRGNLLSGVSSADFDHPSGHSSNLSATQFCDNNIDDDLIV